jgi:TolB-like protein/tetratricopeptide (TPR) repeat protein
MIRFLAELKKRNVFKVATIYVVVSWLLLQVATVVFPVFDIPMWASRLVVILLAIGFPVALLMAWAFDLTPEGIEWQSSVGEMHVHTHAWDWIIAVLLVVAIGLMVSSQFNRWNELAEDAGNAVQAAGDAAAVAASGEELETGTDLTASGRYGNSIAVLPFDSLSADPGDDYIAVGLAEELLSVLGRVDELKIASRMSTAYFRDRDVDHAEIASTLRVEHILSGSVRRVGQAIRVTVVLDDAESGELLWTDTFDRTLDDILGVQAEIARSVASAVVPVLSPESEVLIASMPTSSPEAFNFYLRGLDYLRRPPESSTLASATGLFDRAISIDPRFAQAFAGKCEASLGSYEFTKNPEHFEDAESSCHRALTLNNGLWEVHLALGNLYRMNGLYERAASELEVAIAQQPDAAGPYLTLASIYAAQDRPAEAESMFRRAEAVESGYWRVHNEIGHFYYDQSKYDQAIRRYQRVVELAPDNGIGYDNLGNTHLALGNLDEALQAFNASPLPSRWTYTNRGLVYYYKGDFEKAAADQQRAIDLAPDNHRTWGRLADAARFIPGKNEQAGNAYRKAIELAELEYTINPSSWDNAIRLAAYCAHEGERQKAQQMLDHALEQNAEDAVYYFAAIVALRLGEREQALAYLREAVERGFSTTLILKDPDLVALHEDDQFSTLVSAEFN